MRNKEFPQKKVLSLVLCVAVMLSVMVTGAGAAFSDQDKIENTEAVDACSALNIIGGYPDGSYKPEGNIKRSEICKMICVALNGGEEPTLGTPANPTFSDVRNTPNAAWAEKYIESCVSQGIVSGVGGGRFSPNGNVTGSQLAKMLLVCLGFDSDIEGYTGNAWDMNVNVRATQKGLYKGLEGLDVSAALTRDNAAQMVWNALNAYEVEYKTTIVTDENGNLITQNVAEDKQVIGDNDKLVRVTLLGDKYEASVYEGILVGSGEYGDAGKNKLTIEVKVINGAALSATSTPAADTPETFKYSEDMTALAGQYVKVLVDDKGNAYGVFPVADENSIVTDTFSNVKVTLKPTAGKTDGKVEIDGIEYKLDQDFQIDGVTISNLDNVNEVRSGDQITFISNDGDSKFDTAIVNPMTTFGEVLYIGEDTITVAGASDSFDKADVTYPDDLAEGDYVAVYADLYTGNDKLVKADKISGEIEMTKDNDVRVDGAWYTLGDPNAALWTDIVKATIEGTPKAGDDYTLYVVNGVVYNAELDTAGSTDTAMVIAAPGSMTVDGNFQVKLLFADNTQKVIEADKSYNGWDGKLVTYEKDSKDVYELTEVDSNNRAGGDAYDSHNSSASFDESKTKVTINGADYRVSSSAAVYVQYKDSDDILYRAMTGSELNKLGDDFTANKGGAVVVKDGLAIVVLLKSDTNYLPGAGADQLYGYVTEVVGKSKDYTELNVWTSENEQLDGVRVRGTAPSQGDLISFNLSSDNYLEGLKINDAMATSYTKKTVQSGAIKTFEMGEYVTFHKANSGKVDDFNLTEDTEFLYLNTKDHKGVAGNKLSVAQKDSDGQYFVNAKYIVDNDGDIVLIACDVTSRCWYDANDSTNKVDTTLKAATAPTDVEIAGGSSNGMTENMTTDYAPGTYTYTDWKMTGFSTGSADTFKFTVTGGDNAKIKVSDSTIGGLDNGDYISGAEKTATSAGTAKFTVTCSADDKTDVVYTFTVAVEA